MRSLFLFLFLVTTSVHGAANPLFKVLPENESLMTFGEAKFDLLSSKSIKALIWNIKKSQMKAWKDEFLDMGKGMDLFLVQEAHQNPSFNEATTTLKGQWNFGISFLYRRYGDSATGSLVGGNTRALESFVLHSPDREPITATPKSITFARYSLSQNKGDLLVVSVHGINFETNGAFRRQMDEAFEEMAKHKGPILFAGDFNAWNNSRTNYLKSQVEKLGMKEVPYQNRTYRKKFNGYYLDYAFFRGMEVRSADVLKDSKGSDHVPMVVEFSVP